MITVCIYIVTLISDKVLCYDYDCIVALSFVILLVIFELSVCGGVCCSTKQELVIPMWS